MPKQQDRSALTAKANSQPEQANASNNAVASKESEILQAIVRLKPEIEEDSRQNLDKLSQEINGKLDKVGDEINGKLVNIARDIRSCWIRWSPGLPRWRAGLTR